VIDLSISLLEEYLVLARRLNFGSAAKELCMTQSALSKHMAILEKETGLNLITRGYRITLTPTGKAFLRSATTLVYDFKQAVAKCKEIQNQETKTLRLHEDEAWAIPTKMLYDILQLYKKHSPSVVVNYVLLGHRSPIEALRDGRIDCAIALHSAISDTVESRYVDLGIRACYLTTESIVLWANHRHPLIKKDKLTIHDLASTQIITSSGRHYDPMRAAITEICNIVGLNPNFDNYSINSTTEFFMIEPGAEGVFILTSQTLKDSRVAARSDMAYRALEGRESKVSAYLIALEDTNNPIVTDFIEYAKPIIEEQITTIN
jgi:DNA-binding transcriptional LysR family regulator